MPSFKKNESFYIRDGWFSKALIEIQKHPNINIFSKNQGMVRLGIGSNMVQGLKYWLSSAHLISGKDNKPSEFGNLLLKYDRYLESNFSWFLIHYFLSTNYEACPVFNIVFNNNQRIFQKVDMLEYIESTLVEKNVTVRRKYVEDDFNVFLRSYFSEEKRKNPEDNYNCPLSDLGLLKLSRDHYVKCSPDFSCLSPLIVLYALEKLYPETESFLIEDAFRKQNSPALLFCLDKTGFLQYLDKMQNMGLVRINRTAGLNSVYFERRMDLKEIFEKEFGKNV